MIKVKRREIEEEVTKEPNPLGVAQGALLMECASSKNLFPSFQDGGSESSTRTCISQKRRLRSVATGKPKENAPSAQNVHLHMEETSSSKKRTYQKSTSQNCAMSTMKLVSVLMEFDVNIYIQTYTRHLNLNKPTPLSLVKTADCSMRE
jgi:hypothetical protein